MKVSITSSPLPTSSPTNFSPTLQRAEPNADASSETSRAVSRMLPRDAGRISRASIPWKRSVCSDARGEDAYVAASCASLGASWAEKEERCAKKRGAASRIKRCMPVTLFYNLFLGNLDLVNVTLFYDIKINNFLGDLNDASINQHYACVPDRNVQFIILQSKATSLQNALTLYMFFATHLYPSLAVERCEERG